MTTDDASIEARVKALGRDAGFDRVRITTAGDLAIEGERYRDWVRDGRQGEMRWIDEARAAKSASPRSVFPAARSVITVALAYRYGPRPAPSPNRGRIARYAWGGDYHAAMNAALGQLRTRLAAEFGGEYRAYVDTGPMMDKALAARAGLGWYGKNTNLLTPEFGSFVLLGEILTSLDLAPDSPLPGGCGSCRLCLQGCPTGALGPEYSIDARRCISYLTIELRGPIPRVLRPLMGAWIFGCDICQDVCPPSVLRENGDISAKRSWTAEVRSYLRGIEPAESAPAPPVPADHSLFASQLRPDADLLWLLRLSHSEYVEAFRGSAIRRAKVWMLRRNAAVALGNVGVETAIGPLREALTADEEPIVRGHAAWALGRLARRLDRKDVVQMLVEANRHEVDETVREEIDLTLAEIGSSPIQERPR